MRRARVYGVLATIGASAALVAGGLVSAPSAQGAPTPLKVLAVGDSYASGLGAGGLSPDRSAWNTDCGRATGQTTGDATAGRAYPVVAAEQLKNAGTDVQLSFVACSGRTTNNWAHQVAEAYRHQGIDMPIPAAEEAVPTRTSKTVRAIDAAVAAGHTWDVVTVTFGGNNLQVLGFLSGCMDIPPKNAAWTAQGWGGCDVDEKAVEHQTDLLVGRAPLTANDQMVAGRVPLWAEKPTAGDVDPLFHALAKLVRPGGRVVVVGYPQMFADPTQTRVAQGWPSGAPLLGEIGNCQGASYADVNRIRKGITNVSAKVRDAVEAADAAWQPKQVRFDYIDTTAAVYEKDGASHGLCSDDPWIHGIGTEQIGPLHPTQAGQTAIGRVVAEHLAEAAPAAR